MKSQLELEVEELARLRAEEQEARDEVEAARKFRAWWLSQSDIGRDAQAGCETAYAKKYEAKAATEAQEQVVRSLAGAIAEGELAQGRDPYGRKLHPSLLIARQSDFRVYDLVKTVELLSEYGKEHVISFTMRGETPFFKDFMNVPGVCSVVKIPQVKIDSNIQVVEQPEVTNDDPRSHHYGLTKEKPNRI